MPQIASLTENQTPIVRIGTKVSVEIDGEPQIWKIVNAGESDVARHKISANAPLAQLMLGWREGDIAHGQIHGREVKIQILKVEVG